MRAATVACMDVEVRGRVLVVGSSVATNARVVGELEELGLDVVGCTSPQHVAAEHDARAFDVIAFGRATLGPVAYAQQKRLRHQHPGVRFVEAIGPLAVRQIVAALRGNPAAARYVATLDVEPTKERGILRADVVAPCTLRLWLFRLASGVLTAETLALVQAERGIFTLPVPPDRMHDAYSFVAEANDDELVHFPVLAGPSRPG